MSQATRLIYSDSFYDETLPGWNYDSGSNVVAGKLKVNSGHSAYKKNNCTAVIRTETKTL